MTYSKRDFLFPLQLYFLSNIKPENKLKFKFNLIAHDLLPTLDIFVEKLSESGIDAKFVHVPGGAYMDKIIWAASQNSTHSIKMDDDSFTSSSTWDYWLENIDELEQPDVLTLSPLISTGIPTVDWYADQLFDKCERDEIYDMFREIHFEETNGADYRSLNKFTTRSAKWDADAYYDGVSKIDHYYKGIHPMRKHRAAQFKLNEYTIKHFDRFCNTKDMSIKKSNRQYLCPQLYSIKTENWRTVLGRKDLQRDAWDEVTLSLYREENNLKHSFIHGGFGVHLVYNWVADDRDEKVIASHYLNKLAQML